MKNFYFREITPEDAEAILTIYNSNKNFLLHHLGQEEIGERFLLEDQEEMRQMGFSSYGIVRQGTVIGLIDFKPGASVYLSLFMLSAESQHAGAGAACYREFEKRMRKQGAAEIWLDVVTGYPGNASGFWEKQGFARQRELTITWGERTLPAVRMIKQILSERKGAYL